MGQTYYFSDLIKQHGVQRAQEEAKNLNNRGNTVIVDAESIIDREPDIDTAQETLKFLTQKGYKVRINMATLKRDAGENASDMAETLKTKYKWDVYDATPQTRQQVIGLPMESAHRPVEAQTTQPTVAPQQPPQFTGPAMRAATPQEAKEAMQPMKPVSVQSRTLQESVIEPGVFKRARPEPEGVVERTAQRFTEAAMAPMGAAIGLVSNPEQYWQASKSLSNLLTNATWQTANALGLGNYKYSDYYQTESKNADEDVRKALSPIDKAVTAKFAIPIVGLQMVSAVSRGIADVATTLSSGQSAGGAVAGATLETDPGTAALVDPIGSAFEAVGNIGRQGYLAVGGSEETAGIISNLGMIGMLAAFHTAAAEGLRRTKAKVDKSEPLTAEEKQIVDQAGGAENIDKTLEVVEQNTALLGHLRDWQIMQNAKKQAAVRQSFRGGPEEALIGYEQVPGTNQILEVYDAQGIRENAGRIPQERLVNEGGKIQGGADLQLDEQSESIKKSLAALGFKSKDTVIENNKPRPLETNDITDIVENPDYYRGKVNSDFFTKLDNNELPGYSSLDKGRGALIRSGIDGTKYWDEGSRSKFALRRSRNYVIFENENIGDPEIISGNRDITKELGGFSDPIGAVVNLFRRPSRTIDVAPIKFEDPEVEARHQEAKGIKQPRMRDKVLRAIEKIKLQRWGVKDYNPTIDPQHAANYEILRQYQAAPERADIKAHDIIAESTKGLKPGAMDFFEKVLSTQDLMSDVKAGKYEGKDLPGGFKDAAHLESELARMESILNLPENAPIKQRLDLRNDLTRQVVEKMVELNLLPESVLEKDAYYHHQVLKYYNDIAPEYGGKKNARLQERGFGAQKKRVGSAEDYNTRFVESEFEWLRDALEAIYTRETVQRLVELNDISETIDKTNAKAIPDGYVKYNIDARHHFYKAYTLAERMIERIISGEPTEIKKEDLKQVFAAKAGKTIIIPKDLANTLEQFREKGEDMLIGKVARKVNSSYKVWTLFNPYRVTKYMINNISGDMDITVAAEPRVLKFVPKATIDLFNHVYRRKYDPKFKVEYDDMVGRGIGGGGITLQEIPDISKSAVLQGLIKDPITLKTFVPRMAKGYFRGIKEFNNFRENILRLAADRFYQAELAKGKKPYGVSNRMQMKQLYDAMDQGMVSQKDVAAKLARNLLGDYGDISQAGRYIREKVAPFWSWVEINSPRYYNLIRNIAAEEGMGKNAAVARVAAVAGKKVLTKAAKTALLMHGMYALVNMWNRSMFPQEDDQINKDKKELYLITGRNEDGTVNKLRFSGALTDALELFGIRNLLNDVDDIAEGKKELKDVAWDVPTSAAESLIQRVNPIYKAPVEMLTGRSLYPKIFQDKMPDTLSVNQFFDKAFSGGREIRDRAEFAARVVSMDWLYRKVAKIPEANFDTPIEGLVFTKTDPGQAAYYRTKEMVYDWLKRTGRERPGPQRADEKANSLFYFKMAMQYKRPDLADYWEKKYYDLGGTEAGLKKSVNLSAPLGQLGKGDEEFFYGELNEEQQKTIQLAEEWYEKTLAR